MTFDHAAFTRELNALRGELQASIGEADLQHFRKMERWGRAATAAGWATAWIAPNPLSAGLIALGATARWTIVAHHTSHRGLDRTPGGPRAATFAQGARRLVDWLDWLHPAAWDYEHNVAHHSWTGETADPDLVEENMRRVREAPWSGPAKWSVVAFYACTWRLTYYAPNAWQTLRAKETGRDHADDRLVDAFDPRTKDGRAFLGSLLPFALGRFVLAPAAFLPLGPWAAGSALANSVLAEVLTNLYTFVLITPNHAGDDLYRFDEPLRSRGEFYLRQILGSVNYATGSDGKDFLQGFLNYQIEHHLFPDLPPLKYREAQPRVKAICEKYGVPYVQEGIFTRVRKLLSIMVGGSSMRRARQAREVVEPGAAEAVAAE